MAKREFEETVYPQPPFPKGSAALKRLKEESLQHSSRKRVEVSPFITKIIEARDRVLQGEGTPEDWELLTGEKTAVNTSELPGLIVETMKQVLPGLLKEALKDVKFVAGQDDSEQIEPIAKIMSEAKALISGNMGGEENWEALLNEIEDNDGKVEDGG